MGSKQAAGRKTYAQRLDLLESSGVQSAHASMPTPPSGFCSGKILVVDDEPHIVRLMQVNLERVGFTVVKAYDGNEALEQIRLEQPDLVFLDAMMPHMDGFEVLQNLRKHQATRDLPVIMLTAKAQDADIFRAWQSGVDGYLTKPFNPVEIMAIARRILEKG